ncbi:MAG: pelota family protein, partial [Candidatus Heimdallarchaeota archaeon]|nr:pelota family protein [Candidatus Heimdallarchaeota archaeon]
MKIVDRNKVDNSITVIPQDSDDLYILHNIISPLDYISAKTSRRIKRDEGGSGSKERTAVTLKIQVESTEFRGFDDIIRIKGKIIESSDEQISLGTYHSIKIELLKKIKIEKLTKWSSFELEKLEEAQLGFSTGLLAVIIDDESVLVSQGGNHASRIILDLEPTIPRKGSDPVQYEKAIQTMFKDAAKFLHDKSREGISKQIVLGGPGFIYQAFLEYLKFNYPDLAKHTISFGINNAGRNGIKELLIHHLPDNFVSAKQAREQAILVENVLEELERTSRQSRIDIATTQQFWAALRYFERLLFLFEAGKLSDKDSPWLRRRPREAMRALIKIQRGVLAHMHYILSEEEYNAGLGIISNCE